MCSHFIWLHSKRELGRRTREQPIKIYPVNCKMWNRGLERLPREGNVCRKDSPSSLAVYFPSVRNAELNKQKIGFGSFVSPLFFGERSFKPRDPARICLDYEQRRRASVEHRVVAPTRVPTSAKQQTPSRALSSENWSCVFEQKGNSVS